MRTTGTCILGRTVAYNRWMNSGILHGAMIFMVGLSALKASSKRTWLQEVYVSA